MNWVLRTFPQIARKAAWDYVACTVSAALGQWYIVIPSYRVIRRPIRAAVETTFPMLTKNSQPFFCRMLFWRISQDSPPLMRVGSGIFSVCFYGRSIFLWIVSTPFCRFFSARLSIGGFIGAAVFQLLFFVFLYPLRVINNARISISVIPTKIGLSFFSKAVAARRIFFVPFSSMSIELISVLNAIKTVGGKSFFFIGKVIFSIVSSLTRSQFIFGKIRHGYPLNSCVGRVSASTLPGHLLSKPAMAVN